LDGDGMKGIENFVKKNFRQVWREIWLTFCGAVGRADFEGIWGSILRRVGEERWRKVEK